MNQIITADLKVGARGMDSAGDEFISSCNRAGVDTTRVRSVPGATTSRCLVLTSPLGRTMRTAMSQDAVLAAKDLDPTADFGGARWTFLSAYAVHQPVLLPSAARCARDLGSCVMLDLASWETVRDHSDTIMGLLMEGMVDCCICNEVSRIRVRYMCISYGPMY